MLELNYNMKHIIKIFIFFLFAVFYNCNDRGKSISISGGVIDSTKIVFSSEVYDFGALERGELVVCKFNFKNEGKNPLLISDVRAGCGCTNVKFPLKPVAPGKGGAIEVTYNTSGKMGFQHQLLTVYSNGSEQPVLLTIKANVQ